MSLIVVEYLCAEHGRFESMETRPPPDDKPCPTCDARSPWCISAPLTRVKIAEAGSRGKFEPPPRGYLDTRAIGEGQPLEEWKADRAKQRHEERMREAKEVMRG